MWLREAQDKPGFLGELLLEMEVSPEEAAVEEWMLKEEEDLGRLLTNGAR